MKKAHYLYLLPLITLFFSGCKSLVNELAFHPDQMNVLSEERLPKVVKEFVVQTEDGVTLTSLYLRSKDSNKLVIYFHGNAGNVYHRIPILLQLYSQGVNVIGVSYRGYGKSEGVPSEEGVYRDGRAILGYATDVLGFSKENIIIFGRSIGTAVAVNTAQNEDLNGLILATPLTSGRDVIEASGSKILSFLAGDSFNNLEKITNVKSPLLVIHGTNDQVVPYSLGKKLIEKSVVNKQLVTIEGGNHNNLQSKYSREYWLPIFRFIERVK